MKIAVLGNQARATSNFWTVLLRRMNAAGHEVLCLTPEPGPDDNPAWEQALEQTGARLVHYPLDRKGLNPVRDCKTLLALRAIFRHEQPDHLFAFTIKPVIYGALAAALAGYPARKRRSLMITGLGYMFEADSPVKRLLTQAARLLYRLAFSCAGTVFFQNHDDRALFERLSIIPRSVAVKHVNGTGVDTSRFTPTTNEPPGPVFLYVGRLLEAKGIRDIAAAAALVHERHPDARFLLLGPAESGPGSVPLDEVKGWQERGLVEYLGETQDVRPYLTAARAVLLPSRREGTPCSLMEALSCGRPVIAADAPGSREVTRHGENGFLTPVGDAAALATAVTRFIDEPELAETMGRNGRLLMQQEYDAQTVAAGLLRDMDICDLPAEPERLDHP